MKTQTRSTKSLILKTAQELILSYGYQGFSYNDIASEINIRKSSIHYHFPTKQDLGIAFINKYSRLFSLWGKRVEDLSSKDKLKAFCKMYGELSQNCTRICPIGMVAADYHNMPEGIQNNAQKLILQVEKWLEEMIREGMTNREFKQTLDPQEMTRHLIYALSGALKMARIFKDRSRITQTQEALMEYLCLKEKIKGVTN
ncbi:MAG: TetR/AcrR family transcriptional regulator [Spirochaetaceae bacterium]|nr:TetR/AcrR family transcriptional regulator [Spirochaetaceae bacterium]